MKRHPSPRDTTLAQGKPCDGVASHDVTTAVRLGDPGMVLAAFGLFQYLVVAFKGAIPWTGSDDVHAQKHDIRDIRKLKI